MEKIRRRRKTRNVRRKLISFHESWQRSNGKITDEVTTILEEHILLGMPLEHCCSMAQISTSTFGNWMDRGEKYMDKTIPEESEMVYGEFRTRMLFAIAQWHKRIMERSFTTNFTPNWSRDLALLERKDRDNWGRESTVNVALGGAKEEDLRYL